MAVDRSVQVGIIGQGGHGHRLADLLASAGHVVVSFDVDRQPLHRDASDVDVRQSVGAAVSGSDVVVTLLGRDDALRAVSADIAAVAVSSASATALLDLSHVLPATLLDMRSQLQHHAIEVFGAALIVSRQSAASTAFIDGDVALPSPVSRVARALAARVVRCGAVGSSKTIAIIDRLLVVVNMVAAAEAVALAKRAGMSADVIVPLLLKGSGASAALFRAYADKEAAQAGCQVATVDDMRAMLGRALQLGAAHDHSLLFAALSQNAYRAASGLGLGDEDFAVGIPWAQHARDDAPAPQPALG